MRATCARSLVASGLITSLGVWHRNRSNPFCLADDLLEPWRPIVDWKVRSLFKPGQGAPSLDDRSIRAALLSILNETVVMGDRSWPVLLGIQQSAASLANALVSGDHNSLLVPNGIPIQADRANCDTE